MGIYRVNWQDEWESDQLVGRVDKGAQSITTSLEPALETAASYSLKEEMGWMDMAGADQEATSEWWRISRQGQFQGA